jgi:hypothetical protein
LLGSYRKAAEHGHLNSGLCDTPEYLLERVFSHHRRHCYVSRSSPAGEREGAIGPLSFA